MYEEKYKTSKNSKKKVPKRKKKGRKGVQVVIPYRGDELDYRHLKVMGDLGQIVPQFYSSKDYDSIYQCVKHSNVVFNLTGRDYETR